MSTAGSRGRVWAAFAVIYLVWGSTFLGIRIAVETLPPLAMAAVRFSAAGVVLLAFAGRAVLGATRREWRNAAVTGALFFFGNHALVCSAARYIPSSLSCLIIAGEVPIIAVLSSLILPDQPLTRRSAFGAALGFAGVASMFAGHGLAAEAPLWPCVMVFGASVSWALGAVISQRLVLPKNPALSSGMQMVCGSLLLWAASLARGEQLTGAALSPRSVGALVYLIFIGSVVAFVCYTSLLRRIRAETVATHVFVNPLVAVALGAWLAGERLHAAHFAAGALILCSVLVLTSGSRREAPAATILEAETA